MSQYQRVFTAGGTYFFTLVTYQRKPVFNNPDNIQHLRSAFHRVKNSKPFIIDAIVIMPDHLHCIWRLPENDTDYSSRWREIKKATSRQIDTLTNSRRERLIWQRRFWEHCIRDEEDWRKHMDYIHYNPVKHKYVNRPQDWPWSSFSKAVAKGWYDLDWDIQVDDSLKNMDLE